MSPRALIAAAVVLAAPAAARAEVWDAAYGFGANAETIGGDGYGGALLHAHVGRRLVPRIAVTVTAELASATSGDIEGGILRGLVGFDAHVIAPGRDMVPNLIVALGGGRELIAWDRGTLTRGLAYLGVEYRASFRVDRGGMFRNFESLGFRFGVRGQVSPGVAPATVAKLCTACMDRAAEPAGRGFDAGVAFYMGLLFGR